MSSQHGAEVYQLGQLRTDRKAVKVSADLQRVLHCAVMGHLVRDGTKAVHEPGRCGRRRHLPADMTTELAEFAGPLRVIEPGDPEGWALTVAGWDVMGRVLLPPLYLEILNYAAARDLVIADAHHRRYSFGDQESLDAVAWLARNGLLADLGEFTWHNRALPCWSPTDIGWAALGPAERRRVTQDAEREARYRAENC